MKAAGFNSAIQRRLAGCITSGHSVTNDSGAVVRGVFTCA
jgi:hypothetical protein